MLSKPLPPTSEEDLIARASKLAGRSLGELAEQAGHSVPDNLLRKKGWIGQFLEWLLGATAASKSEPDFLDLGIELKSLPVTPAGKPIESTFVSTIQLTQVGSLRWRTSLVYNKLQRVLWIPILCDADQDIASRRIGMPHLWSMGAQDEAILQQDWQELTDMISMGQLDHITAKHGQALQVRPKGANAKSLCWGISETGEKIQTLPRGFYLRPQFTHEILQQYFL